MADSGLLLASQLFVGDHLWHILMLAAWIPLFGIIVLAQRRHNLHSVAIDEPSKAQATAWSGASREFKGSQVRWYQCMALGSVCAALIHVAVMPDHFAQSREYGLFFLLAAIGQLAFAVALVARPTRSLVAAGITASTLIVMLWLVSRFIGIPIGPDNGATEPIGYLDILASVAETCVVAFGVMARRNRTARPSWRWSEWSLSMRLAAPICITGTVVASLLATRS